MVFEGVAGSEPGTHGVALRDVSADLQDMVLESRDVAGFLDELARLAVEQLSAPGREVFCGVTLLRPRRAGTVASSSAHARELDEIQYGFGDGPCLTAARTEHTMHVPDILQDRRWPEYQAAVAGHGVRSILGVPVPLDGDASCALNLYSTTALAFTEDGVGTAEAFARAVSKSLRLAVRIAHLSETRESLKAAMASRTTIDLAVGIVMAQNRCSQATAVGILKAASGARNTKLRDIAAAVVASVAQEIPVTHFEE